jgi:hypothetical protein
VVRWGFRPAVEQGTDMPVKWGRTGACWASRPPVGLGRARRAQPHVGVSLRKDMVTISATTAADWQARQGDAALVREHHTGR